ncbi:MULTISPECIES: metallophosphoesterase family protein [Streptomyces]|uniref:Metallophosphoesterase n=2 Tax=Streptomyces cacaoi TaxID=1898 RepID=A0A4Y3QS54_STRCI|nr:MULTISPECIES: metallophosphoesterase [Streptomyces]NNG89781.1 metallophosphoesterase [Streptomyces cacaoi]QHF95983.1 metallophosphoesterase [Streptomyces sp. NHF165]GEB47493.1 metallophosphoesterase [Streptomyces cacaoi]
MHADDSAPRDQDDGGPGLYAVSDLHIVYDQNKEFLESIRPRTPEDWLIVAGDVSETADEIAWALRLLAARFARVIWVPGNHELWTPKGDPNQLRGEERYRHLVAVCREAGVVTPEDPFPVWEGAGGPVTVAPLFLLYDYSFRPEGTFSKKEALEYAYETGVVCTDEVLLHPDPFATRDDWCRERVRVSQEKLARLPQGSRTILVNHWPLVRDDTRILRYPEFAQWCGTTLSADWHVRYSAAAVVYGHLHIPRTTWHDGVPFHEVSVGYPREWTRSWHPDPALRRILPAG